MEIKVGRWLLKDSEGISRFDVHQIKKVQSGKHKGEDFEVPVAYGCKIDRCIDIIIQEEMKETIGEINLPGFLKEYKEISHSILSDLSKIIATQGIAI